MLPTDAPQLSALALVRSASLTVFVFGNGPAPLLVAKLPGEPARLETEARALERAAAARLAPAFLGRISDAFVQEALHGAPLALQPLTPGRVLGLGWSAQHEQLASALERLAAETAQASSTNQLRPFLDRALAYQDLDSRARRLVAAAGRDLDKLNLSVLMHDDLLPQNCLFDGVRLVGVVDWEFARTRGIPGYDVFEAALAYLEHGVGLASWSEQRVLDTFRTAWPDSGFWRHGRSSARRAAAAAGVPERFLDALEVAFFARRLGHRLDGESMLPTGPATAARMLELACRD